MAVSARGSPDAISAPKLSASLEAARGASSAAAYPLRRCSTSLGLAHRRPWWVRWIKSTIQTGKPNEAIGGQLIEVCLMSLGCGTSLDYSDAIAFLAGVVAPGAHKEACLKKLLSEPPL